MIGMRQTTVGHPRSNADGVLRAMSSWVSDFLSWVEDHLRPRARMRMIASDEATLTGLAESPHTTICLSPAERDQARAIEEAAQQTSEPALS